MWTWQDLSCFSDRPGPRNGGLPDPNVARIRPPVPNPGTARSLSAAERPIATHHRGKPRKMSREYAVALGARLRAIRRQHGLTLQQVHQRSGHRWSTVVLGSYERADRAMSVTTLADLAAFYGMPTEDLLPTEPAPAPPQHADRKLTIDLQRIPALPTRLAAPLARYTAAIQHQRHSHTGTVLTIRDQDLHALAVLYDTDPHSLTETLTHWGVLAHQHGPAAEEPSHPIPHACADRDRLPVPLPTCPGDRQRPAARGGCCSFSPGRTSAPLSRANAPITRR